MPWRRRLIHCFARSFTDGRGNRLRSDLAAKTVDRIGDDPELLARFESLEEDDEVGREFLKLYEEELSRSTGTLVNVHPRRGDVAERSEQPE